jgi:D-glycero-D-manno-heptose 1,7-bisphosphate phosphatase
MPIQQAVILCGGKGTRLAERVRDLPKPMIPLEGRPVLDHIISNLAKAGIRRFLLAAGYHGDVVARYYATTRHADCRIEVLTEPESRGTAGALRWCAGRLEEDFVLAYGDVFLDFDARRLIAAHETQRRLGTLLVRVSDHPWDSHLVVADEAGRVVEFVDRREPGRLYRNVANAAVHVLSRRVLDFVPEGRPGDLGADVFPAAIARGETLGVHFLEEEGFVKDMGTPERLAAVEEYLADRALAEAARARPQPLGTVFLDRDGVLNVDSGLIDRPEKLELLPGAVEAMALLRCHGIRCVVTTNQPVVARGLCTMETLEAIHDRLRAEIGAGGGKIDAIYFCPHHPETHHGEGVPELRRACRCRKPAPGLIFRACRELGLDLAACVMVGDRASDVRAGRAAGIRTVLLGRPEHRDRVRKVAAPDAEFDSLLAFVHAAIENGFIRQ